MTATPSPLSRRRFFARSGAGALALAGASLLRQPDAHAMEPFRRAGSSRLRLSLAAYSFRDYFGEGRDGRRITLEQFIDYCADHGCDGAELTSYYFPPDPSREFLIGLKRHAHLRGVAISGTAVGNNFAQPDGESLDQQIAMVREWIERAAMMGAPHIRVFAGQPKGLSKEEAKVQCVKALELCGNYAAHDGVWLGLENHGGIVAQVDDLLDIVRAVKSSWVGVNLDTGNIYTKGDPYEEMARLAPYAVNVQLKVRVGGAPTDLDRVVALLKQANYQGYVALEYEDKDPWGEIPRWLARMKEAFAQV
ncbi:MAG: sugar phosphate isomerase/epimerase [Verrucomicrobiales bacterium]|nr:sugar phosphate isomerase/epimerase [Verrucomicrobiales bacterium]